MYMCILLCAANGVINDDDNSISHYLFVFYVKKILRVRQEAFTWAMVEARQPTIDRICQINIVIFNTRHSLYAGGLNDVS